MAVVYHLLWYCCRGKHMAEREKKEMLSGVRKVMAGHEPTSAYVGLTRAKSQRI